MEIDKLDLGTAIDELYKRRAERLAIERTVKDMKAIELRLRVHIKQMLDSVSLEGARGSMATAAIQSSTEPTAGNWEQIYEYIKAENAFDILQRRLSPLAIKERWDSDILIPGIEKFDTWDLSINKRSS